MMVNHCIGNAYNQTKNKLMAFLRLLILPCLFELCFGSELPPGILRCSANESSIGCKGQLLGKNGFGIKLSDSEILSKTDVLNNDVIGVLECLNGFLKSISNGIELTEAKKYLDSETSSGMPILSQPLPARKAFSELFLSSTAKCIFQIENTFILYCYSDSSNRYLLPICFQRNNGYVITANKKDAKFKGEVLSVLSTYGNGPITNFEILKRSENLPASSPIKTNLPPLILIGIVVILIAIIIILIVVKKRRN